MLIDLLEGALRRRESISAEVAALLATARRNEAAGATRAAIGNYRELLALDPHNAAGWSNLGWDLQRLGQLDEALVACQQALACDPGLTVARNTIGTIYRSRGQLDAARTEFEAAFTDQPHDAVTRINLGLVLLQQGGAEAALAHFRDAVAESADMEPALRTLLQALRFLPVDAAETFAFCRAWAARCEARTRRRNPSRQGDAERRLRVGYLAVDFDGGSLAGFVEALFSSHDTQAIEVFCYANSRVSAALRSLRPNHWRNIHALDDEQAADLVEQDQIDVLVDLCGHVPDSRLEVFACRAAPVQVSLADARASSGIDAMDYCVTDATIDPPGVAERFHSERIWRLPDVPWCQVPPAGAPEVAPQPALATGHVTFGAFAEFAALNHAVTALWIELLRRCEDARLLVTGAPDGEARRRFAERFAERGVAPSRLEIRGIVAPAERLDLIRRVDITLDPFPASAGREAFYSLWMGVPVVTLAGTSGFARFAAGVLHAAGLDEFVAESPVDYVNIATRLAADRNALERLRASLRERVSQSSLCDAPLLARRLEHAYRAMWREYCSRHTPKRELPRD
jgi:predicted O-linked N-acetylglucosamine transferase (SPINDLY family)